MRALTLVLILSVVGCANQGSDSGQRILEVPGKCQSGTTVNHLFREWGTGSAQDSNCPGLYDKMDCHLFQANGQSTATELICQNSSALDPSVTPSGCTYYAQGAHEFMDHTVVGARGYDCGVRYGALRCFYYTSISAPANAEIICLDNDLPL